MVKQVQIGKDPLNFSRQENTGINCPPCQTPTPTPTVACITVNLKTSVACNNYTVKDSLKLVSTDKLTSVTKISDNELIMTGYGSCLSINDNVPVSRALVGKTKLQYVQQTDGKTSTYFSIDSDFGTKGKVNSIFYNSNNLRVSAKFDHITTQTVSGQTKIIAAGQTDYKALVARYSATGALDRTFGSGTGYVTIDTIGESSSIKLLDVFGLHIQTDNKILLFCNGYDIVNKRSLGIVLRLTNSGLIDNTFNNNKTYIQLRSSLSEFDGSKFIGKEVYFSNDTLYIVFETFSSIKQNTVIVAKYNMFSGTMDENFGDKGYIYANTDNKNTYLQNIFVKTIDNKNIICLIINNNNTSLQINKYAETGIATTDQPVIIPNTVFTISDNTNSGSLKVNFENIRCNQLDLGSEVILFLNLSIKSNSLDQLGGSNQSLLHWLEKQSLITGQFNYSGLDYRDCTTVPCDRQPEDSYGTLGIKSQSVTKYDTSTRVLFGYLKLSNNITTASPIKLDRFSSLDEHNIVKRVIEISPKSYVLAGYYGSNTYSNFGIKTITLNSDTQSFGPRQNEVFGNIDFSDFCNTTTAIDDGIVIEECPCAPAPSPTPSPTPPPATSDIFIDTVTDSCDNQIPVVTFAWKKNKESLAGSYVIQITKASDKSELVAASFEIKATDSQGSVSVDVSNIDKALNNNKTCIASILDNTGTVIFTKIFVLNIRNCA
jgi:hypothetical protein